MGSTKSELPFEVNVLLILILKNSTCCVLSCSVMSDSLRPYGLEPARLLCPWEFSRQEYWTGLPCLPPADLPNPGIEPKSLTLQTDSLPTKSPGKPKKTGVGSLPFLQGNFPTQGSNWGLLHCRWILYQLSYQGSPIYQRNVFKARIRGNYF